MTDLPYTRAEVTALSRNKPQRGLRCRKTLEIIPVFGELPADMAEALIAMTRAGQGKAAQSKIMEVTGCSQLWATIWTVHAFCDPSVHE